MDAKASACSLATACLTVYHRIEYDKHVLMGMEAILSIITCIAMYICHVSWWHMIEGGQAKKPTYTHQNQIDYVIAHAVACM